MELHRPPIDREVASKALPCPGWELGFVPLMVTDTPLFVSSLSSLCKKGGNRSHRGPASFSHQGSQGCPPCRGLASFRQQGLSGGWGGDSAGEQAPSWRIWPAGPSPASRPGVGAFALQLRLPGWPGASVFAVPARSWLSGPACGKGAAGAGAGLASTKPYDSKMAAPPAEGVDLTLAAPVFLG